MNLDLMRRFTFTLGALLVYRLGTHIPLPGIDVRDQFLAEAKKGSPISSA
jgi:preprotein translocase subunit SecY